MQISRIEAHTSAEKYKADFLEGNVFYLSLYLYFTEISYYHKISIIS